MRIAPYDVAPWKIDKYSVNGEAQQVVASGFDPFLPESTLKLNFSTFGSISSVQNKTDPETGMFLGIGLIKYRDNPEGAAAESARRAEREFNGQRIGVHVVTVELDREGRKCKRKVEQAIKKAKDQRAKDRVSSSIPPPAPTAEARRASMDSPAPPVNAPKAPKGPSGKKSAVKIPEGPKAIAPPLNPRSAAASLIEDEPILSKIKRKPYIHIPHRSVPVLGTTIPHLKKRLKAYDWREVRLDRTGYYVVFEDSKRGEDETERCFAECNKAALFTYNMEMECQKYGNPNYERSPSPERVMVQKQKKEHFERLQREEKEDLEIEKKNRAENLDPVRGALEQLKNELRDKIMGDIKTRIAIPIFHDSLDPGRHTARRRKLGLPDPLDNENKASGLLYNKAGETPPHTPRSRFGNASKPLRPHDPNSQRGKKGDRDRDRAPQTHSQMSGGDDQLPDLRTEGFTLDSNRCSRMTRTPTTSNRPPSHGIQKTWRADHLAVPVAIPRLSTLNQSQTHRSTSDGKWIGRRKRRRRSTRSSAVCLVIFCIRSRRILLLGSWRW